MMIPQTRELKNSLKKYLKSCSRCSYKFTIQYDYDDEGNAAKICKRFVPDTLLTYKASNTETAVITVLTTLPKRKSVSFNSQVTTLCIILF
jgi:hypothetical protein